MGKARAEILKIVKNFKKRTARKYDIKKLILFGSQARGEAKKWSDIDLLVVSPKFAGKKALYGSEALYGEWHLKQRINQPVDFICYSPKEFEELKKRISLVSQAVEEGMEI